MSENLTRIVTSMRGEMMHDFLEQVARTALNLYVDDDLCVIGVDVTRTLDCLWRADLVCVPSEPADADTPQGQRREEQRNNVMSKSGAEWHAVSLDLVNHALGICASIYGECYLSLSALWDRIDASREGRDYDDIIEIALSDADCRMIDGARTFAKYQHRAS